MSVKVGEVIEASTLSFSAQCYELHQPPSLGSLVRTREGAIDIYGMVIEATTSSIEPGRRPIARGREEGEEEDIFRSHPQLSQLLRTEFQALILGHSSGDSLYHYLPPRPPRLHSFVYLCTAQEARRFSGSLDFLPGLVAGGGEEAIAACLRHLGEAQENPRAFLVAAGKELTLLLRGELPRLNAILKRIRP